MAPFEWLETTTGRRSPLEPPARIDLSGDTHPGDFQKIGQEFLGHFIQLGGLRPDHRVLDVGSGCGRMAVPLTQFLLGGTYDGVEIIRESVRWSRRAITRRFPNFHFQHADVANRAYNPEGRITADQYSFPFPDRTFDFVFLTSVFTHMRPPDVENYLRETARVLRVGGASFVTWFLLNDQSLKSCATGKSDLSFDFEFGGFRSIGEEAPERAVSYDEYYVRDLYSGNGLTCDVHYGSWSGSENSVSFQDIAIGRKIR